MTRTFEIQTEERWLHYVSYSITADNEEEALKKILSGDIAYDVETPEEMSPLEEVHAVRSIDMLEQEAIGETETVTRTYDEESGTALLASVKQKMAH